MRYGPGARPVLLLMHGNGRRDFPSITNYTFKAGQGLGVTLVSPT